MSIMRAKLYLESIRRYPLNGEDVKQEELFFRAVAADKYPAGGSDENNTYALWTPRADLSLVVTNPALIGKLRAGQSFYVDFTLAES